METVSYQVVQGAYEKHYRIGQSCRERLGARIAGRPFNPLSFGDLKYDVADESKIKEVIAEDLANEISYIARRRDCENIAYALMGILKTDPRTMAMPIFLTWRIAKQNHAVVTFYIDGKIKEIEAQDDTIYAAPVGRLTHNCG